MIFQLQNFIDKLFESCSVEPDSDNCPGIVELEAELMQEEGYTPARGVCGKTLEAALENSDETISNAGERNEVDGRTRAGRKEDQAPSFPFTSRLSPVKKSNV